MKCLAVAIALLVSESARANIITYYKCSEAPACYVISPQLVPKGAEILGISPACVDGACPLGGGGSGGAITTIGADEWRLVTQTYGGRIDIRKGLTEQQCEHDRLKALSQPADEEERAIAQRFHDEDTAAWDRSRKICPACFPETAYVAVSPMRISSDIRRAICEKQ